MGNKSLKKGFLVLNKMNLLERFWWWENGRSADYFERMLREKIRKKASKIKKRDKAAHCPLGNIGATLYMLGLVSDDGDKYCDEGDFLERLKKTFSPDVLRIGSVLIYQGLADSRSPLQHIAYTAIVTNVSPLLVTHLEYQRGKINFDENVDFLEARKRGLIESGKVFYSPRGLQ